MLTDKQLQRLPAGMHADAGGLYIRVSPKGKKSWVVRRQAGGRDTWKTIGTYPGLTLAEARRVSLGLGLEVDMPEAIRQYMSKLQVRRPEQVELLLRPLLQLELSTSRRQLTLQLQNKAGSAPVMANRMLTRWQDFFNFSVQQGWLESNPLFGVQRKFIGGKEKSKNRVLTDAEIHSLTDPVLLYILLTGLRPSEAIHSLTHSCTVDIPTKTVPHTLPRSHLIQYALKQKVKPPASHLTLSNRLRRAKVGFTPHDIRRTFGTRLNELGVAPHIVEKLMNHKLPGIMAVYNHAEYWPERHAAQRVWDKYLLQLRKKTPA